MAIPIPGADARFSTQYAAVVAAAAEQHIELEIASGAKDPAPTYVYEKNRLLARREDLSAVSAHLPVQPAGTRRNLPAAPVLVLDLDGMTVPAALARLDGAGLTGMATPNHLVSICPVNLCPGAEPTPMPANTVPMPPAGPAGAGDGVRVEVVDTGLITNYRDFSWITSAPEVTGAVKDTKTVIREYVGHGTFIAGVLRRVAPSTTVHVSNDLFWAGAILEDQLGKALMTALDERPHIISLSAGGTTHGNRPHLGLEPFMARLQESDRTTLLVAAAGNDGDTEKFWPAAYAAELPDVVLSVGALREDGRGRACFSNSGDWVRVYAPGERLVNAFPTGHYTYVDAPSTKCRYHVPPFYCGCTCVTPPPSGSTADFVGRASWSGTSFATPVVAGAVAAYMTEHPGMSPRKAAHELMADQDHTAKITDVDGTVLTILQ